MEGGLTRKRGFLLLVALLLMVLLVLWIWRPAAPTSAHGPIQVDSTLLAQLEASDTLSSFVPHTPPNNSPSHTPFTPPSSPLHTSKTPLTSPNKQETIIDLNRSDTAELQQLWGIGPVLSGRIVKYRALLGGFVSKQQLREVYGVADSVYERIAPRLTADTTMVRKMDLNTASRKQLSRHPYLDNYQADAIVRLREKQGPYQSLDDLRQVPIIDPETYNKIIPYLTCNSQPKK